MHRTLAKYAQAGCGTLRGAFSGSLRDLELVPAKWCCLVPPASGYPAESVRDLREPLRLSKKWGI